MALLFTGNPCYPLRASLSRRRLTLSIPGKSYVMVRCRSRQDCREMLLGEAAARFYPEFPTPELLRPGHTHTRCACGQALMERMTPPPQFPGIRWRTSQTWQTAPYFSTGVSSLYGSNHIMSARWPKNM